MTTPCPRWRRGVLPDAAVVMSMTPVRAYLHKSLSHVARMRVVPAIVVTAVIHAAALLLMLWSESTTIGKAAYVLAWVSLNCFWIAVLRRPAPAAGLSLAMFIVLVLLSRFKHNVLLMTVSFVDVMVIDHETFAFLLAVFPHLSPIIAIAAALAVPLLVLLWRFDPLRVRLRSACFTGFTCMAFLTALSFACPNDRDEEFWDENYVSKFARSGTTSLTELVVRGLFDADTAVAEHL